MNNPAKARHKNLTHLILFSITIFSLNANSSLGATTNTITAYQTLSGDQTIISAGGVFALGFFKPGKSSRYYIGMWYKELVTEQTVIWVANREKPVSDKFSSELRISKGNLVLFDEKKIPVWSTNISSSSATKAVLLDAGNLILTKDNPTPEPIWQSQDHLTDTFIPGWKFGVNKRTGKNNMLISWKNSEDPSAGLYSIELVPEEKSYSLRRNRSLEYFNSGGWNGRSFSMVPETNANDSYNFTYMSNENESYFIYWVDNTTKTKSRFTMDVTGQLIQPLWVPPRWSTYSIWTFPSNRCQVYAVCGIYSICNDISFRICQCLAGFDPIFPHDWDLKDYSSGCFRKTLLKCRDKDRNEDDVFLKLTSVTFPDNDNSVSLAEAESSKECEEMCSRNCSCTAYSYGKAKGCLTWTGDILNLQQLGTGDANGMTLHVRLTSSELRRYELHDRMKGFVIWISIGSALGLVLIILILALFFVAKKYKRKEFGVGKDAEGGSLTVFAYRDLQNATKNFSEKLGGGGFGSVFKGVLHDSSAVAVKKLESVQQGEKEFRAEVSIIGTIQHVNLVRLQGFCSQGAHRLLVYDYLTNGSLGSHIFNRPNNKNVVLEWNTRYQIALGIAKGLAYLHEKCRDCIIHCDIKPENVLLDEDFSPKVADFGLAKLVGRDFSRVLTTIRGTIGYLAPEWIAGVAITPKADVYSYGMMVFEIISGRRNSENSEPDSGSNSYFPSLAAKAVVEYGDVVGLLDPRLEGNADVEELERVCRVACWCIQDDESHRPSMGQVVQILEGILDVKLPPVPRSLYFYDVVSN